MQSTSECCFYSVHEAALLFFEAIFAVGFRPDAFPEVALDGGVGNASRCCQPVETRALSAAQALSPAFPAGWEREAKLER